MDHHSDARALFGTLVWQTFTGAAAGSDRRSGQANVTTWTGSIPNAGACGFS